MHFGGIEKQARLDVTLAVGARQRDLSGDNISCLTGEQIKRRLVGHCQRNAGDRSHIHHAGNSAEFFVGNNGTQPNANGIGAEGQYDGPLAANTWYRIAFAVDLTAPDGQHFRLPTWVPGSYLIREFARHFVDVWAETPGDHPDGICIDAEGAVWYADVGNQHCVRVREGGEVLATVKLDRGAFACALSRGQDPRLFVVGQNFGGPEQVQPSGRVVVFPAPAPGAGKP